MIEDCNQENTESTELTSLYKRYFENMNDIVEIDHVPNEII